MIDRLRRAWRSARGWPGLGAVLSGADRVWWLRSVLRSGLMDAEYYALQRGWGTAGPVRASVDYVVRGFRDGLSPNPLFDETFVSAQLPDSGRVPALYAYAVSDRETVDVHPWWDASASSGSPSALERVWGARQTASVTARIGAVRRPVRVVEWRAIVLSALAGHDVTSEETAGRDRVVRLLRGGDPQIAGKVKDAAEAAETADLRLVVSGPRPAERAMLAIAATVGGFGLASLPAGASYAEALRRGVDEAAGTVVVIEPRTVATPATVRRLRASALSALVAPVTIEPDGTLGGIGAVIRAAGSPARVRPLRHHPRGDLTALGDAPRAMPLLSGGTFAAPAGWLRTDALTDETAGFEAEVLTVHARSERSDVVVQVDAGASVRATWEESEVRALPPALRQMPDATAAAADVYEAAGFQVESWPERPAGETAPLLRWVPPVPGAMRWAIKTSAPAGPRGEVWGDAHFAQGLARALRRRGQTVVLDAFPAAGRATTYLDDVHLVVRGPFRIDPPSSGVRVEWIISHPDEITSEEVKGFDRLFAVSPGWAQRASARWGVDIRPLLECTDADLFFPHGAARTEDVVFVGTARGIARPSVVGPLAAGIDVRVYGPDWRGFIPARAIAAVSIPHEDLSERYESASVVLNDHWPAMRREGFMAMRPFDVVASGGRVLSERVDGLGELFRGAVVEFDDVDELVSLLRRVRRHPGRSSPDDDELAEISAYVRAEHSFDARADVLIAAVQEARGDGG